MRSTLLEALVGRGPALPALAFALLGTAVFLVASRLARHADAIADATGLGRLWIGTVLLSTATSLPELTTDVSAAALGAIDIGVGDLFGSTLANMLILAVLDLGFARRRILQTAAVDHALVGALAIVMTAVATLALAAGGLGRLGPVGIETPLLVGIYLFGMRAVYHASRATALAAAQAAPVEQMQLGESRRTLLRRGVTGVAFATLGLLLLAPLLVIAAEAISMEAGVSQGFIGTTLVGFTTSFPEIAASVVAVRMGAIDLAVGNLLGSNAFNLSILLPMDLAHSGAPILAVASPSHLIAGIAAMQAIALGVMALLARAQQRPGLVRLESLLIVASYALAVGLLARG